MAGGLHNSHGLGSSTGIASGFAGFNAFGSTSHRFRTIESHIMNAVFKALVTRCVANLPYLRQHDSVQLYCDVRQMMSYIKETHGGVFRRVALSCIFDVTDKPHQAAERQHTTARVVR